MRISEYVRRAYGWYVCRTYDARCPSLATVHVDGQQMARHCSAHQRNGKKKTKYNGIDWFILFCRIRGRIRWTLDGSDVKSMFPFWHEKCRWSLNRFINILFYSVDGRSVCARDAGCHWINLQLQTVIDVLCSQHGTVAAAAAASHITATRQTALQCRSI